MSDHVIFNQKNYFRLVKMVKKLENKPDFDNALKSTKLVVVDFFAEWCGPCKYLAPILEELQKENPTVEFYKVDVDENSEVAEEQSISAMPTIKFFKNGTSVAEVVGADANKIKDLVAKHK